ncbi:MAG: hypothetical protein KAH57_00385 [Thermoplasmata archaeon]|nr:hypothetical protein [Thermoplasmata archaeon]
MKFEKGPMACAFTAMLIMTMMLTMIDVGDGMPSRAAPTLSGGFGYGTMYEDSFFNFSARYTDTDGDVPYSVNVTIDRTNHTMINTFGTTNYASGVDYHYNTSLVAGTHSYYFFSMNDKKEWITDPASSAYSLTVLSRNGSLPTLTSPSIYPSQPKADSPVNFTVTYTDADGDSPNYVNICYDRLGDANPQFYYNMTELSDGDGYYPETGMPHYFNRSLPAGSYSYYFYAMNDQQEMARSPSSGSLYLNISDRNQPQLFNRSVDPSPATINDTILFSVSYRQLDGYAPSKVQIVIMDMSNRTLMTYNMTVHGTTYATGVRCTYSTTLARGTYEYRFSAKQGNYSTSWGSWYLNVTGGSTGGNRPILYSPSVSPSNATVDDNITFSIYYKDIDNDAPDYVRFHLWKMNKSSQIMELDLISNMTGSGTSYTTGVKHAVITKLGAGGYLYYFTAESNEDLTYNGNYSLSVGSSSNRAPFLSNPQVSPTNPSTTDTINFTVTYQDLEEDAPEYIRLVLGPTSYLERNISMPEYDMTIVGTSYSNGIVAFKIFQLAPGNYSYGFVTAANGEVDGIPRRQVDPLGNYYYSLYVRNSSSSNSAPQLLSPSVSPARPFSGQLVTFSATYKDADNDPPEQFLLKVTPSSGGAPLSVKMVTPYSYAYSTGLAFSGSIPLTLGNYTYYFTVTSKNVTVNLPATGSYNLYVSAPPSSGSAPTLYNPRVSPSSPINNQAVNFTIYYKDLDDDAPSYVKLYISSANSSRTFTNYSMRVSGSVYSQGVLCLYTKSLASGTYYYRFQAGSGNDTVTYPSTGYGMLVVGSSGGSNSNDTVRCAISVVDGEVDMEYEDEGTTITLSILGLDDDSMRIEVGSDTGESKVIILDIDPSVLDLSDPDRLRIAIDGVSVSLVELDWMNDPSGSEPRYHLVIDDEGAHLYLYMPDTSSHIVEASIVKDDIETSNGWVFALMAVVVILVIAAVALALLSRAQVEKRKKVEEYYEDFDISAGDDRVTGGRLEEEESSVDWDELI